MTPTFPPPAARRRLGDRGRRHTASSHCETNREAVFYLVDQRLARKRACLAAGTAALALKATRSRRSSALSSALSIETPVHGSPALPGAFEAGAGFNGDP
jgi:hypothetical protein